MKRFVVSFGKEGDQANRVKLAAFDFFAVSVELNHAFCVLEVSMDIPSFRFYFEASFL